MSDLDHCAQGRSRKGGLHDVLAMLISRSPCGKLTRESIRHAASPKESPTA